MLMHACTSASLHRIFNIACVTRGSVYSMVLLTYVWLATHVKYVPAIASFLYMLWGVEGNIFISLHG